MADDFLTQVRVAFSYLEETRGFRLVSHEARPSFGDALADFEASTLRVRVLRDRGQIYVDVAPAQNPATWFDLPLLLTFLGAGDSADALVAGGQRDMNEVAALLRAHYDGIERTLGQLRSPDVVRRLSQLRSTRADARFGGSDR